MKALMISADRTLLAGGLGDVKVRHQTYASHVERLDILVFTRKEGKGFKLADNSLVEHLYLRNLFSLPKKFYDIYHYDLIVCQDPFFTGLAGLALKRKVGPKLLVHFHGDFWDNPLWLRERWYNTLLLWLSRYVVRRADAIRVMSQGQIEKLVKAGISKTKIRVISTPVDLTRLENYPLEPKHQKLMAQLKEALNGQKMILMVGRKDQVKDFETLFAAISLVKQKYSNVTLWLLGNYKTKELDKDLVGLVNGVGNVDAEDLPAYYYTSDLAVLSSTSESFGKVLVEANACTRPVVATETTGTKEIIQQGYNGYLVPIKNPQALASRIVELLSNPQLANQMGENGRKLVQERFSHNTEKIIRFWEEIVNTNL